jgi:hypothetical protein
MRGDRFVGDEPIIRLPQPSAPVPQISTFVACPMTCLPSMTLAQWICMQAIYQAALAEAQAVVRPSLPERDLVGSWN